MARRKAPQATVKPCRRLLSNVTDSVTGKKVHAVVENHVRRKGEVHKDELADSMSSTATASTEASSISIDCGEEEFFDCIECRFDSSFRTEVRALQNSQLLESDLEDEEEEDRQIRKLAEIIVTEPSADDERPNLESKRGRRGSCHTATRSVSQLPVPMPSRLSVLKPILTSSGRKKSEEKTVSFASAEFREYPVILGDNPACSQGAPITIGWDYDEAASITVDIEEYEEKRPRAPRNVGELNLSKEDRFEILRESGYTQFQIACAVRRTNRNRGKRYQTINGQGFARVEECGQSARRKMLRAVGLRKTDEAEVKKLWKKAARLNSISADEKRAFAQTA